MVMGSHLHGPLVVAALESGRDNGKIRAFLQHSNKIYSDWLQVHANSFSTFSRLHATMKLMDQRRNFCA
uniref:Uncharacterized protein n=1 Tax=Parascaris univalens TaxID=6257 RepID=A0A915A7T7_PARUN